MLLANVEEQYKKYPELDREIIKNLQEWSVQHPTIPSITELEAIIFFHITYYNEISCKKFIENHYKFRFGCPEVYRQRNILGKDMENAMETIMFVPLPGQTRKGYKAFYSKFVEGYSNKFIYIETLKFFSMATELWLIEEGCSEGDIMIVDMEHFTIGHLSRVDISTLKKLMTVLQDTLPIRLKEFHFFNASPILVQLLTLMKLFMKKSFTDVLHIHSTKESVYEFLPKEMLPNECGGTAPRREHIHFQYCEKLKNNAEYFLVHENRENAKRVLNGTACTSTGFFSRLLAWFRLI